MLAHLRSMLVIALPKRTPTACKACQISMRPHEGAAVIAAVYAPIYMPQFGYWLEEFFEDGSLQGRQVMFDQPVCELSFREQ